MTSDEDQLATRHRVRVPAQPPGVITQGVSAPRIVTEFIRYEISMDPHLRAEQARLAAFDPVMYARDPATYLAQVIPSRILHMADPATGATPLQLVDGGRMIQLSMLPAGADLVVLAAPGWPVTFVSQDRGRFANGHTTMTVQAALDGRATAHLSAETGTTDIVRVTAASPVHTGAVEFRCMIKESL